MNSSYLSMPFMVEEFKEEQSVEMNAASFTLKVEEISAGIKRFPYEELRSIPYSVMEFSYELGETANSEESKEQEQTYYHASATAITTLIALFTDKKMLSYLNKRRALAEEEMLQLADALVSFREGTQLAENAYFEKLQGKKPLVELPAHSGWIGHFLYTMERHLPRFPHISMQQYGQSIKNFQALSEKVHTWILINRSDLANQYRVLQSLKSYRNNPPPQKRLAEADISNEKEPSQAQDNNSTRVNNKRNRQI
ncbi:MAG: hypothetical protein K0S27_550 [Gammaproteobacteria bacterium]|jgi:hypothetical protein|nr:hypothetical protein [Gammaproteobacteria bacterium]